MRKKKLIVHSTDNDNSSEEIRAEDVLSGDDLRAYRELEVLFNRGKMFPFREKKLRNNSP